MIKLNVEQTLPQPMFPASKFLSLFTIIQKMSFELPEEGNGGQGGEVQ